MRKLRHRKDKQSVKVSYLISVGPEYPKPELSNIETNCLDLLMLSLGALHVLGSGGR